MKKKKTLMDFVGILKVEGEYDFQEARKSAQEWVAQNYALKEEEYKKEESSITAIDISKYNMELQSQDDDHHNDIVHQLSNTLNDR